MPKWGLKALPVQYGVKPCFLTDTGKRVLLAMELCEIRVYLRHCEELTKLGQGFVYVLVDMASCEDADVLISQIVMPILVCIP